MSSIYGFDSVDDIFNENIAENDDLPGDFDDIPLEAEGGDPGAADAVDGEGKAIKVEPKKRVVRNPRIRLSVETLSGPRGIQTIEDYFKDIKFRGKGREKEDLDEVMRRLQHWAHRMYPSYKFDDVINKVEVLGKKKPLHVHMSRYRLGMLEDLRQQQEDALQRAEFEDEDAAMAAAAAPEPFDEFDALLDEQIAISRLAPPSNLNTPLQHRRERSCIDTNTSYASSALATPSFAKHNAVMSTPYAAGHMRDINDSDLAQPLPPSQPEQEEVVVEQPRPALTAEQMAQIAENRRIAQERLRARREQMLQKQQEEQAAQTQATQEQQI